MAAALFYDLCSPMGVKGRAVAEDGWGTRPGPMAAAVVGPGPCLGPQISSTQNN